MLNFFLLVGTVTDVGQRCERRAVIRPHRVDLVGHGGDERAQDVGSDPAGGLRMQLGKSKLARPLDGDEMIEAASFRLHLGHVKMAGAQRRCLKPSLGRRGPCHLRETVEAMALVAAVHRGPGPVRDAVLHGIEAVIQGQQGRPCDTRRPALPVRSSAPWNAAPSAPSAHQARTRAASSSPLSWDGCRRAQRASAGALDAVGSFDARPRSCGRCCGVLVPEGFP